MCAAAVAATAGFTARNDSTPAAPTITSTGKFVYVNGEATNYVGTPGKFTLSDPGSAITSFYYSLDDPDPVTYVAAGKNGTATLSITPNMQQSLGLSVVAVDGPGGSFSCCR
jgi:hypothetical protein